MAPMNDLHAHPLFTTSNAFMSRDDSVDLSYKRARLVLRTHALTANDVQHCTPKFWAFMQDPILSRDIAMFTVLAAHVGLAVGSLSRHLKKRPDLRPLMDQLLRFDTVGLFLLTERGHGLDAFNIETTAIKTSDGFILNSPREEAWKFMPASNPSFGIPKVALVMAKLIVDGENVGSRLFIVPVCNEYEMYCGVSSIRLPPRTGTGPLDFSITKFDNVYLPPTAIVASDIYHIPAPSRSLESWWDEIWRIQLGTLAVPAPWISALKIVAFVGGRYSIHRTLTGKRDAPVPIISFRTQQWPVLQAIAVGTVMAAWYPIVVEKLVPELQDARVGHAMAVIVKATVCRHFQRVAFEMAERCGAQGTFEQNDMARLENEAKGVVIAEGDVMTLCIRLFSELLLERYTVPLPDAGESLLSNHAWSVLEENSTLLKSFGDHRSDKFNALILPQSQMAIEAIGHAMAYSNALRANIPQPILDIYECSVIRQDPAWYSEHGLTRLHQRYREDAAVTSALPHLTEYLDALDIDAYVSAPIVSDASWKDYLAGLPIYTGSASSIILQETSQMQAMM
ncbi:acyl-CoA oxidase [Mycena floridula]|nr:acyl-CoA oxidase [Mycena floridula]